MPKQDIQHIINTILMASPEELFSLKAETDQLVSLLCKVTDIDLHPAIFHDEHATETMHGKAVSMTTAAQCAEEFMRTQVFLRGVFQAIQDQLKTQDSIRILYAGTGPFGLLVVPLLHQFTPDKVQVYLLDIHQESLDALQKLIEILDVDDFIENQQCTDILQWPIEQQQPFDLIISETMKAMLDQEPQVSVFRHLIPLLKPEGELIPQQIQIKAWLAAPRSYNTHSFYLGEIFTLDRQQTYLLHQQSNPTIKGSLDIPEYPEVYKDLKFTTDIQVYGRHWLTEHQCSLNLPKVIIGTSPEPGSQLRYQYEIKQHPEFTFDYESSDDFSIEQLPDHFELSETGIPYLKRCWYKAQLLKQNHSINDLLQKESELDQLLFNTLLPEPDKGNALLYQSHSLNEFERYMTHSQQPPNNIHKINIFTEELRRKLQ
ncbi:class I SAM-dependent methyltransferase [Oceanospirillum sediminis]|uniref:Methyltransferase domain-containing protein n=1 Tax=Oceanospirillum sediminis TaxID=2760088 RepID=A0A839IKR1_9GAMM|nr:class I SAM-dependent methyltransferase [Oceanospirillum sediminis]MBB1485528.1 methyltransferase domain-containing protein [Oceanospirillum sediminis]